MILLNQPHRLASTAQRVGFVRLVDLSPGVPHYQEAVSLDKVLRALDPALRVGFIYDPQDRRLDRWAIMRYPADGSQQLVRIVQDKERNYQPPDQRVFLDLQKHKLDGPNGRFWIKDALTQDERIAAAKEKMEAEDREEFKDRVRKHVRDNRFKGRDTSKAFIGDGYVNH